MALVDDRRDFIKRVADELERSRSQSSSGIVNEDFGEAPPPGVIPTSSDETKKMIRGEVETNPDIVTRNRGGQRASPPRPIKAPRLPKGLMDIPLKDPPVEEDPGSPTDQYIQLIDSEEERDCIRESMDILYGKDKE